MAAARERDYGSRARIGIAVPFSNPTVEPELRALLPTAIGLYATRLSHPAPGVEERLHYYMAHLPEALATFGVMGLAAFGFGCTGSSYLAGMETEKRNTTEAAERSGVPVITAAQALRAALAALGATRIALVSPYPEALAEAGYQYWSNAGIRVTSKVRVDPELSDTHRIYELSSADALAALLRIDLAGADCLVASGTGMPTLRALRTLAPAIAIPVLSSNLCLAWALLRAAAPELAPAAPGLLLQA